MTEHNKSNYPPNALLRAFFRFPVYIYKIGLGWILGKRFVLFHHVGRKSGKNYQTVVEVVEIEKETGNVIVVSGYGERTQWYQNLKHMQTTTIQLGNQKSQVSIEMLSAEAGADIMADYLQHYPKAPKGLFSILGYEWDGSEQGIRQVAIDHLCFVRFVR